ncbi:MAG: ABC transporter ATP-binding protein [Rivularia sp. T60_A2020_040]|nr:ABC transporter ATP-binding protein [Rivularia sp. T60_A2020_040]
MKKTDNVSHIATNSILSLFQDMLRVMLSYPKWFAAAILSTIIVAAVEPSIAGLGKVTVDNFKKGGSDIYASLPNYIVMFAAYFFLMGLLKFGDKVIDKTYETLLIITLQRTYLQRRGAERGIEDVSRILYDCNRAKPGLDILHKDSWRIVSLTISVIIWQLNLAPELLPALFIAVLPPVLIGFFFGPFLQKASLNMMKIQENIAASTADDKRNELFAHQKLFLRQVMRLESFKGASEILIDLVSWFGILVVAVMAFVFDIGIVPKDIQAGDLVLFWTNLNLLAKPLNDIVKVYNKARESYPALIRVLRPQEVQS